MVTTFYYDVQNGDIDHEHDGADDDGHDDDDSYEDNYKRGNYGVDFRNGIDDIDGDSEDHHDCWLCVTAPHPKKYQGGAPWRF